MDPSSPVSSEYTLLRAKESTKGNVVQFDGNKIQFLFFYLFLLKTRLNFEKKEPENMAACSIRLSFNGLSGRGRKQ